MDRPPRHGTHPPGPRRLYLPPPTPGRRRRVWLLLAALAAVLGLLGVLAAGMATSPSVPVPAMPTTEQAPPIDYAPRTAPAAGSGDLATSFGDGDVTVAVDVVPGIYVSPGAREDGVCVVTAHAGPEPSETDILLRRDVEVGEPIRLKVTGEVRSVRVRGCEDFVRVSG